MIKRWMFMFVATVALAAPQGNVVRATLGNGLRVVIVQNELGPATRGEEAGGLGEIDVGDEQAFFAVGLVAEESSIGTHDR
jgi:hypothetical protein